MVMGQTHRIRDVIPHRIGPEIAKHLKTIALHVDAAGKIALIMTEAQ